MASIPVQIERLQRGITNMKPEFVEAAGRRFTRIENDLFAAYRLR